MTTKIDTARQWVRVGTLLALLATAGALYIIALLIVGRTTVREAFDPTNQFTLQVTGCDVTVIPADSAYVEIQRVCGSTGLRVPPASPASVLPAVGAS